MEILQKKGPLTDVELLKEVNDAIDGLSFRELNNLLLRLEVMGVVRVTRLMKGKRRVELTGER
ncbi:MAG: hypothetical protein QW390_03690 [Candidatus Bathyarchaeia archaeon]